jgi:hypothetical protein
MTMMMITKTIIITMLPILPRDCDAISSVAAVVVDIEDPASIAAHIEEGVYTYIALNANEPSRLLLLQRGFKAHCSFREIDDAAYSAEYAEYVNMPFSERWPRDAGRGQVGLAGHIYSKHGHGIDMWDVRSGHYIPSKSDGTDFGLPEAAYTENIEEDDSRLLHKHKRMRLASLHTLR